MEIVQCGLEIGELEIGNAINPGRYQEPSAVIFIHSCQPPKPFHSP